MDKVGTSYINLYTGNNFVSFTNNTSYFEIVIHLDKFYAHFMLLMWPIILIVFFSDIVNIDPAVLDSVADPRVPVVAPEVAAERQVRKIFHRIRMVAAGGIPEQVGDKQVFFFFYGPPQVLRKG
jgi:hypothetical protein